MSFDTIFQFELDFGVIWAEFEGYFIDKLRCKSKVTPSLEVLKALVLKSILASFEEFRHRHPHCVRHTLVSHIFNYGLLHIISHESEWFRSWWS